MVRRHRCGNNLNPLLSRTFGTDNLKFYHSLYLNLNLSVHHYLVLKTHNTILEFNESMSTIDQQKFLRMGVKSLFHAFVVKRHTFNFWAAVCVYDPSFIVVDFRRIWKITQLHI